MGALHTVFAFLHAIGKFINASGLDLRFQKADIYGEATIEQIKGGKQMKGGVDASISMCLALQRKYLDCLLLENIDFEENLKETVKDHAELISKHKTVEKTVLVENYHQLLEEFAKCDIFEVQKCFDAGLKNNAKFLRNYMKMVEILLRFIRATRQGLWDLHLTTLDELVKYFFALELPESPVYLSQIYALKNEDPVTWKLMYHSLPLELTMELSMRIGR